MPRASSDSRAPEGDPRQGLGVACFAEVRFVFEAPVDTDQRFDERCEAETRIVGECHAAIALRQPDIQEARTIGREKHDRGGRSRTADVEVGLRPGAAAKDIRFTPEPLVVGPLWPYRSVCLQNSHEPGNSECITEPDEGVSLVTPILGVYTAGNA